MNAIYEIKQLWLKAVSIILSTKASQTDKLLETLAKPLRSALISIQDVKTASNAFIDSNNTDMSRLSTMLESLATVNEHFQQLYDSPVWDEISNLLKSTFVIKPSIPQVNDQNASEYIDIAKYCDIEDKEFLTILNHILDPVKNVFVEGKFYEPESVGHYSTIVGPSFMGKTQFSFILARIHPVFYFNFCADGSTFLQEVYRKFRPYRDHLIDILNQDMDSKAFSSEDIKYAYNSESINKKRNVKFRIIGFIWNLIEYSLKFDFTVNDGNWFHHYLESRSSEYEPLSLNDFYRKMKELFEDENKKSKFRIPIVFIDELNDEYSRHIKFLRNIVRCLVLPCVLSSTNSKVNNMLNLKSSSSLASHALWVNCIRRLLAANVKGILSCIRVKTTSLFEYLNEDFSFKVSEDDGSVICLLRDLNISFDTRNKEKLFQIWNFIISQSQTCLQGSSYFAFRYFIQELISIEGKRLDSRAVWNEICKKIHLIFKKRKPSAFAGEGKFFSLRMFATDKKLVASRYEDGYKDGGRVNSMVVNNSIDNHFYHFGEENDPFVIPFDILFSEDDQEIELIYKDEIYLIKSHFLRFERDCFTSFSLWTQITPSDPSNRNTVASIVQKYDNSLVTLPSNPSAQKNNSNSQENMVYWAIANASHQNFFGNIGGKDFFINFFKNIQVNSINMQSMNIPSELESFLDNLSIPYLIPEKSSAEFELSLAGLCDFGVIHRCPDLTGFDIDFEFRRNDQNCIANVECDAQGKADIETYIEKAKTKNSVLTIFVSYKIHDNLKDLPGFKDNNKDTAIANDEMKVIRQAAATAVAEPEKKKTKKEFKLNIYSFYFVEEDEKVVDNGKQKQKKLLTKVIKEVDDPDGVFLVLEAT